MRQDAMIQKLTTERSIKLSDKILEDGNGKLILVQGTLTLYATN